VNRSYAWPVLVFVTFVLALGVAACGGSDPYSGTWRDPGDSTTTWEIARANDGWWSIDNGGAGTPNTFYAAEIDGQLQTTNGRDTFTPDDDKLHVSLAGGATTFDLVRR
jgi:hypothetical protein